jgi:hypothetical protein
MSLQQAANSPGLADRILIVRLAKPKNGKEPRVAVIVLGVGIADIAATGRFAKHGWLAMQIRLIRDNAHHADAWRRYDTYSESGVSRCIEAMDFLSNTYGIRRFILMGNCALANICFNTATADPRVAGLILTNPHVSDQLTNRLSFRIRRHLLSRRSWLRLLRGKAPASLALTAEESPELNSTGDVALPLDFDRRLELLLAQRQLRVLIAFAHSEPGLIYFLSHYRRKLDELATGNQLRFEVISSDSHDFSASDESASKLNALIADWVGKSWNWPISRRAHRSGHVATCELA